MTLLLTLLYAVFAILVLIPTLIEQQATARHSPAERVAGIAACLVWPVTLLCLAAHLGWRHLRAQRVPARA